MEISSQTKNLFEVCSPLKLFDIQKLLFINMASDFLHVELEASVLDYGEEVGILNFETLPGTLSNEITVNLRFCLVNDLRSPVIAAFEASKMLVARDTQLIPDNSVDFVTNINRATHGKIDLVN